RLRGTYPQGIRFVDLGTVVDPQLVASVLASAVGVPIPPEKPLSDLTVRAPAKRRLLIVDGCEHVVEAVASAAEQLLKLAPEVHILAPSREPLRAESERVLRLPPLAVPSASTRLTAAEALAFSAVQLFVERTDANQDGFELTDANAPLVADLCR